MALSLEHQPQLVDLGLLLVRQVAGVSALRDRSHDGIVVVVIFGVQLHVAGIVLGRHCGSLGNKKQEEDGRRVERSRNMLAAESSKGGKRRRPVRDGIEMGVSGPRSAR